MTIEELCSSAWLAERLDDAVGDDPLARVHAAAINSRGMFVAHTARDGSFAAGAAEDCGNVEVPAGCFAKMLTAALVAKAISSRKLRLDDDISAVHGVDGRRIGPGFPHLSIGDLLRHTHGLDASAITQVPRLPSGRIDLETLRNRLTSVRTLAEPGTRYSYGSAGAWILGGLLERLYDRSYDELLGELLREDLQCPMRPGRAESNRAGKWCPAIGGGLAVSIRALVGLLRVHLGCGELNEGQAALHAALLAMRTYVAPVEGWSVERGAAAGVKCYGNGWFGHDMQSAVWTGLLRLKPDSGIGFLIVSRGLNAYLLQPRLFQTDLADVRSVRLLSGASASPLDKCVGTYENAAYRFVVTQDDGRLRLRGGMRDVETPPMHAGLRCVGSSLFLADQPVSQLRIIQFIGEQEQGYRYLWNTRELFQRS